MAVTSCSIKHWSWSNVRKLQRCFSLAELKSEDQASQLVSSASVYIHWPFCRHICPYCNFNKYLSKNVDHRRMEKCLSTEFKNIAYQNGIKRINTIYFGGGTPGLCKPSTIQKLINKAAKHCYVDENTEISIEVNPSGDLEKLRSFKNAGINRVSIGIQALNDGDLARLGRDHSKQDAISCIEEADKIFQGRISIDLMFGRPGQTLKDWINELRFALQLSSNHVSLYQLTMERSTPMEKQHRKGEITLPDSDEIGDMYHASVEILEDAGLKRYEVANFCREGFESQHNSAYWHGDQYLGIGPGAHGRLHSQSSGALTRYAHVQTPVPEYWMKQVEMTGDGVRNISQLSPIAGLEELILQGMRSIKGVDQEVFSAFAGGFSLISLLQQETINELVSNQLLMVDTKGIRATSKGMALLDSIVPQICLEVEEIVKLKKSKGNL